MPINPTTSVIDHLRRAVLLRDSAELGDGDLLVCFIERHDQAALATLIKRHGPMVWGVCRRQLSHHDAEDAFQRAVEILLTKAPEREPNALVAWMQVVTRREALAVRRARERILAAWRDDANDIFDGLPCERPGPMERAERRDNVAAAAEALAALKHDERLAIVLQAHGYSYAEIGELCDWTYTKVNRCLAEGRARLRLVS